MQHKTDRVSLDHRISNLLACPAPVRLSCWRLIIAGQTSLVGLGHCQLEVTKILPLAESCQTNILSWYCEIVVLKTICRSIGCGMFKALLSHCRCKFTRFEMARRFYRCVRSVFNELDAIKVEYPVIGHCAEESKSAYARNGRKIFGRNTRTLNNTNWWESSKRFENLLLIRSSE